MKRFLVIADVSIPDESLGADLYKTIRDNLGKSLNGVLRMCHISDRCEYQIEIVNIDTGKKLHEAPFRAIAKK